MNKSIFIISALLQLLYLQVSYCQEDYDYVAATTKSISCK